MYLRRDFLCVDVKLKLFVFVQLARVNLLEISHLFTLLIQHLTSGTTAVAVVAAAAAAAAVAVVAAAAAEFAF